MTLRIATIGVYGLSGDAFLDALRRADVSMVFDLRQRRGVRGPDHCWANSLRLQASLAAVGVGYAHHPELAPTTELRQLQYAEDARLQVGKRSRRALAEAYIRRYTAEILDPAELAGMLSSLPARGRAALFCVEREPGACHRSLVAQRLAERHGLEVEHLMPIGF